MLYILWFKHDFKLLRIFEILIAMKKHILTEVYKYIKNTFLKKVTKQ